MGIRRREEGKPRKTLGEPDYSESFLQKKEVWGRGRIEPGGASPASAKTKRKVLISKTKKKKKKIFFYETLREGVKRKHKKSPVKKSIFGGATSPFKKLRGTETPKNGVRQICEKYIRNPWPP